MIQNKCVASFPSSNTSKKMLMKVEGTIEECGRHGWTVLNPGIYNITRYASLDPFVGVTL